MVPKADYANMSVYDVDHYDMNKLYDILETKFYQCITTDQMNGDKSWKKCNGWCKSSV